MTLTRRASIGTCKCAHSPWSPPRYIYQSCLRLSAVIRNGTHYMSISVAVPLRQLRRIAKSAAVPSPSRVADAGVRRVRSIGRPDRYVRPGWVALPATTRLEEFAHRPFCLHHPSYLHPRSSDSTPALGPPFFLRSLLVSMSKVRLIRK
jgi:hypothetical protein